MLEKIKAVFPSEKAWTYVVEYDKVQIGIWDGEKLNFKADIEDHNILELRVFNNSRELRFFRKGQELIARDSMQLKEKTVEQQMILYGTSAGASEGGFTPLKENRAGILWFPGNVLPPINLNIRNYYRFHPIAILSQESEVDAGIIPGQGALDFFDYAFAGFYDKEGKAVEL